MDKQEIEERLTHLVEGTCEAILAEVLSLHVMGEAVSKDTLEKMRKVVKHQLYILGANVAHMTYVEMKEIAARNGLDASIH